MYHFQQTVAIIFIASLTIVQAFVHNLEIRVQSSSLIPSSSKVCTNTDNPFLYKQKNQAIPTPSPLYFQLPWKQNKAARSPPPKTQVEIDQEELQKAARDPKAFEAYVLKKNSPNANAAEEQSNKNVDDIPSTSPNKKGYVPIEQWDADRSKDSLSWEEKVQFDGQRFGNRVNQNEILRNNINRF
uniref:Uncharacterized protein n=1 Tax=Chaetoceros debilis TaxID=122233 RepID=A0A7S3VGV0_9STRA|mmetsp:Transcript_13016/g.18999  ORF Transcript_13016/g.18999 Transcript_13016/m.18999 type:complete len:185 (+) Transcript_13016:100-654(+)